MDPTPIASNAFAQYGALLFVAISGWLVAYKLWGALEAARAELKALNEKVTQALTGNTSAITMLCERLGGKGR